MVKHATPNAAYQAQWRARQIEGVEGNKEKLSLVLERGTKAKLERVAKRYGFHGPRGNGSIQKLIEYWATQADSDSAAEIERQERAEILKKLRD